MKIVLCFLAAAGAEVYVFGLMSVRLGLTTDEVLYRSAVTLLGAMLCVCTLKKLFTEQHGLLEPAFDKYEFGD